MLRKKEAASRVRFVAPAAPTYSQVTQPQYQDSFSLSLILSLQYRLFGNDRSKCAFRQRKPTQIT
jgi:hypothetical protein